MKICLDPGHGGSDPGASGHGLYEKTILWSTDDSNLGIANRIAHHLREAGHTVVLTRDSDTFVTLPERCKIAVKEGCDLFLSVHVNAAQNHTGEGLEVWVARTPTPFEVTLAERLLWNCYRRSACSGMKNRGVKNGNLAVLRGTHPKMPAFLFEVGFVSNVNDAARLGDRKFREAIACSVVDWVGTSGVT